MAHSGSIETLAIVIPAYKAEFLGETLECVANQTNKEFTLYIGDDASPEDLAKIIKPFEEKIPIKYTRFDTNLGATNLVAHWKRCIELVQTENWIWFFSDDDLMDANCVESFFATLQSNQDKELFHFNVKVIDRAGKQLRVGKRFPDDLTPTEFFRMRMDFALSSFVVEYIFNRTAYNRVGGFEEFDLGWCADDAMWMKLSVRGGFTAIEGAYVSWRYSGANISSKTSDVQLVDRKVKATVEYIKWCQRFFSGNKLKDPTSIFQKLRVPLLIIGTSPFTLKQKLNLARSLNELRYPNSGMISWFYLSYVSFRRGMSRFRKRYLRRG